MISSKPMQRMRNGPVSEMNAKLANAIYEILNFPTFPSSASFRSSTAIDSTNRRRNFPFIFPPRSINLLEALVEAISASQLAYLPFPRY